MIFFIDASGFKSILSCIDDEYVKYDKYIPMDSAIVFSEHNTDILNTKPVTEAIAMNNGWMWKIPVGNRNKYGYVFSSKFTDRDEVVDEIRAKLNKNGLYHKTIKFPCKRLKNPWNKNILRMGLSAGFLEPLQATAIHTTIASLIMFTTHNFSEDANQAVKNAYNKKVGDMVDGFVDFISLHYQGRSDNDFWLYMANNATDRVKDIVYMCQSKAPHVHDLPTNQFSAGYGIWSHTLDGLNLISKDVAAKQLNTFHHTKMVADEEWRKHFVDKTNSIILMMISNSDFMRRYVGPDNL